MGEDNDPLLERAYDDKMANYQSHAQKESLSFYSTNRTHRHTIHCSSKIYSPVT